MHVPSWLRPLAARLNRTRARRTPWPSAPVWRDLRLLHDGNLRTEAFRPRVEGFEDRALPSTVTSLEDLALPSASLNQVFVASLYQGVLNRDTDSQYQSWVDALDGGAAPNAISFGILSSPEHRVVEVENLYRTFLDRPADPVGMSADVGFLEAGGSMTQVESSILGSQEFFTNAGGTTSGFLDALYKDVLGRDVDPDGATTQGDALAASVSPIQVAEAVVNSPEAASDEVTNFYNTDLGRAPDASGLQGWVNALQEGTDPDAIEANFLSTEYLSKIRSFLQKGADIVGQTVDQLAHAAKNAFNNQFGSEAGPGLLVTPPGGQNTLTFQATEGSTTTQSVTFTVQNTATRSVANTLDVNIQAQTSPAGQSWLSVNPTSLSLGPDESAQVTVTVNPAGLQTLGSSATEQGTVTVTGSDGKAATLNVSLVINPVSLGSGSYSGQLNTTAFLQGPDGPETDVSVGVIVLITDITADPNNPGRSVVQGQASVTGLGGQTIASTLSGAFLDSQTNTLTLGTIGSGGNSVNFANAMLNGNTFTTSLGVVLNGQDVVFMNSDVTLTKR